MHSKSLIGKFNKLCKFELEKKFHLCHSTVDTHEYNEDIHAVFLILFKG